MPLNVSSTCAHHQVVKIALHSLWSRAQVERGLSQPVHRTATYRCDDTRGCVMQFWPLDDEHMCSKHVEAYNKLIIKEVLCIKLVNYWDKKLYMFRTVPLSIIGSFSLYTQQWYISYTFVVCVVIYLCCVCSKKLLMMDRGTIRNMQNFIPKINLRN